MPPAPGPGAMQGYQPPAPGYQPPGPGQQQPYYQPPANVQYGQPPPQQPQTQTVVVQQAEEPKKGSGIGGKVSVVSASGASRRASKAGGALRCGAIAVGH